VATQPAFHPHADRSNQRADARKANDSVPKTTDDSAQQKAQHYFRKAELQPDTHRKDRLAGKANTARLRELRLAKEAAEKQAADAAGVAPAKERKPARRARSSVRMSY
jgi:hypothetical protein